ncbi:MAG: ATP-binding protein [Bacteroidales bacterium]|nr:ATP-binding protein [Bacteroidales bacterium]
MEKVKRILQNEMEMRLKPQKVMLLFGARRVGKTVLVEQIMQNFDGRTLLLNGESMDTVRLLENRTIVNYRQMFSGIDLLCIDEAQHIPDIGMKLKLIIDEVAGIRIIATGSSSFDLQNLAGEPLVGRSTQFLLTPFSVSELVHSSSRMAYMQKMEQYMVYGHYPELESIENEKFKQEYLNDVVDAYLLRDILAFDGLKHAQKMHDLLRIIAYQTGKEVSLDELGVQLALSRNTVERYLDLLQKAFVLFRIGGFSRNLRKEVSKSSKWYFYDTGIRNAVIRDYQPYRLRSEAERGALWENYFVSDRLKRNHNGRLGINFYFWRTYDQQEIDLIEELNGNLTAIEMKSGSKKPTAPKAFLKAYPDAFFSVLNADNYMDFV